MSRPRLPLSVIVVALVAGVAPAAEPPPVASLKTQKVDDVTYFHVSFKRPDGLDVPDSAAWDKDPAAQGRHRLLGRLPRLVPQDGGTAAVYLDLPLPSAVGPKSLDFAGKVTGRDPARFLLLYPTRAPRGDKPAEGGPAWAALLRDRTWAEVPVTLDFSKVEVIAPTAAGPKRAWANAQAQEFAVLAALAPDFGFYGFARAATGRKYGVEAPALVTTPAGGADDALGRLYEMTTGATALSESLALRRLLATAPSDRERRSIDVTTLPAVMVAEHPWERMMNGKKPEPEPLAALVPHDQYYVTFRSAAALLGFADLLDDWGGLVLNAYEVRGRDYRLRQRYEKQLCLDAAALARTLDPLLLRGIAVTGSDPYLREGSDVTVIFHVNERKPLLDALDPFLAKARKELGDKLREAKEDYAGVAVESFVGPLREVSLHRASFGEFVVCSNSPVGLRRVLDVHLEKRPSLARSADFRYMRTVFRRGDAKEDGFAFLPDAFIRRLVGPASKIKEKRRLEALASLSLATNGALFAGWESGRLPRDHKELLAASGLKPAEIAVPEGSGATWDATRQVAVADAYNTLHFATPLVELPIDRVTPDEARQYEVFRLQYLGLWRRYYDPVGLRFALDERRVRAEALILPLVQTSAYNELRSWTGGKTVAIDSATFSPRTVLAFLAAADPGAFQLRLDDGPALRDLVALWMRRDLQPLTDEEFRREAETVLRRLPLSFTMHVPPDPWLADILKRLPELLSQGEPGAKAEPLEKPQRGAKITRVTIPGDGNLAKSLREFLPELMHGFVPGFYHTVVDDVLYVSVSEDAVRKLIDEAAERRAAKEAPKKEDREVSSAVHFAPAAGKDTTAALNLLLEWETHRRAVGNGPLWYALHRSGVLAADADGAAREAAALRFLGFVPVSPDGSPYRYERAADEVVSVRHGSLRRPDLHPAPDEKSPLLAGLIRLRSLRADLTFRDDGVQTVVTIDRATAAEAKVEATAPGAAIRRLGGRVLIDERDAARPVVKAELRGSGAGDDDLAALRGLDAMRELDLGSTRVTDKGLVALHALGGLRRVYLDGTTVTDAGAAALRKALPGVDVVRWTDEEQRVIAALERLGGRCEPDLAGTAGPIFRIDLAGTRADDETLALLGGMTSLETLHLAPTAVTDKGLAHLHGLTKLRRVYLGGGVTDAGAAALRKALPSAEVMRWNDAERRAVDAVVRLGGRYEADGDEVAGPILGVNLAGTEADDETLALFVALKQLRTLDLARTSVTDKGLVHLHGLGRLECVSLDGTPVTDAGEKALRAAVPGARVTRRTDRERVILKEIDRLGGTHTAEVREPAGLQIAVNLAGTKASDKTLELLKDMQHLSSLTLDETAVTDAGLKHLHGLKSLTSVGADAPAVTDAGADAWAKARPDVTLGRRTDLQRAEATIAKLGGGITSERNAEGKTEVSINLREKGVTAADLARLTLLGNVRSLNLSHTRVTAADLAALKDMKSLRSLDLTGTKLEDAGLEAIKGLTDLEFLDLSWTRVTDDGLAHLKGLTGLRILKLCGTDVSDRGASHLKGLKGLKELNLVNTGVTAAGEREIRAALPKVVLDR